MEVVSEQIEQTSALVLSMFRGDYDAMIRHLCPSYDEMLSYVAEAVPDWAESVVDLGCGTGTLLALVARQRPSIRRLVGVDLDPARLAAAAAAVRPARGCTADFVEADIRTLTLPPADVYVSSLAFHELAPVEQAALYRRVADAAPLLAHYEVIAGAGAAEEAERWAYLDWWLDQKGVPPARRAELAALLGKVCGALTLAHHAALCGSVGYRFAEIRRSPGEVVFSASRAAGERTLS